MTSDTEGKNCVLSIQNESNITDEVMDEMERNNNKGKTDIKSRKRKMIETVVLYFSMLGLGSSLAMVGPTLLDLQLLTGTTTDTIAFTFIGESVGRLLGAAAIGILLERYNGWMLMTLSYGLLMISNTALPWMANIYTFVIVMTLRGFTTSTCNAGGNVMLLQVWGQEHGPWMQALHFTFGIGALTAPLMAKPFLADIQVMHDEASTNITANDTQKDPNHYSSFDTVYQDPAKIQSAVESNSSLCYSGLNQFEITSPGNQTVETVMTDVWCVYLILGILAFLSSIAFATIFFTESDKIELKQDRKQATVNDVMITKEPLQSFKYTLLALISIFYFIYCLLEGNYASFLLTYAVKYLQWSKSMGAVITAVFWTSFTIGRGLGIIFVMIVHPWVLLMTDLVMVVFSMALLMFLAKNHESVLWISTIVFGLGTSTIYATGITWTERYIRVSGPVAAVFMISGRAGGLTGPVLIGVFFRIYGTGAFAFILFVGACIILVLFIIMQLIAKHQRERYVKNCLSEDEADRGIHITEAQPMHSSISRSDAE